MVTTASSQKHSEATFQLWRKLCSRYRSQAVDELGSPFKQNIEKYEVFENIRHTHMSEGFNLSENLYDKSAWGWLK